MANLGTQRGQLFDARGTVLGVREPFDDMIGQLPRLVFAGQIFGEQHTVGIGLGRVERRDIGGKNLVGVQQVDQRDVLHAPKEPLNEVGRSRNPIQNDRGLGLIEQFERYRARDGQAAVGQMDQLRCAANVDLDGQTAFGHGLAGKLGLFGFEASDREAYVGHALAD